MIKPTLPKYALAVSALVLAVATAALLDPSGETLIPIIAALLHECGHIAAIRLCGSRVGSLGVSPVGAELRITESPSRARLAFILSAGALANLLGGIFAGAIQSEGARLFMLCSLALAAVNLLPIESLDGGELLRLFISNRSLTRRISGITVVLLWLASVAMLLFFGNISLYVLSVYLFVTLYLRGK